AEDDVDARVSHHDAEEDHDHDDFDSFVITAGAFDDPAPLLAAISAAIEAHDILRVKGFVAVAGKPARLLVQAVGPRIQHHFDRAWKSGEQRRTQLVVIGQKGLDRTAIEAAISAATG
ncbi:MAG TPA: GTP-binding protein, partial [Sphingomonas sp.]